MSRRRAVGSSRWHPFLRPCCRGLVGGPIFLGLLWALVGLEGDHIAIRGPWARATFDRSSTKRRSARTHAVWEVVAVAVDEAPAPVASKPPQNPHYPQNLVCGSGAGSWTPCWWPPRVSWPAPSAGRPPLPAPCWRSRWSAVRRWGRRAPTGPRVGPHTPKTTLGVVVVELEDRVLVAQLLPLAIHGLVSAERWKSMRRIPAACLGSQGSPVGRGECEPGGSPCCWSACGLGTILGARSWLPGEVLRCQVRGRSGRPVRASPAGPSRPRRRRPPGCWTASTARCVTCGSPSPTGATSAVRTACPRRSSAATTPSCPARRSCRLRRSRGWCAPRPRLG